MHLYKIFSDNKLNKPHHKPLKTHLEIGILYSRGLETDRSPPVQPDKNAN
jgi:hypothetical protein